MERMLLSELSGSASLGSVAGLGFDVRNTSGDSTRLVTGDARLCLSTTWLEDLVLVEGDPLRPASLEDIEPLFESHLRRFDELYRRWA